MRGSEHSRIPIRGRLAEPLQHAIEGGIGSNPSTVTRAIEDLKGSGCRPLAPRPEAPDPAVRPGALIAPGPRDAEGERDAGEP